MSHADFPERLRIVVATELVGGVGVYAANLIEGLSAAGVRLTVVTPQPALAEADDVVAVREYIGGARFWPQARAFGEVVANLRVETDLVHFTDARYSGFVSGLSVPIIGTMNDYFYAQTSWLKPGLTRTIYQDWRLRHVYYNFLRTIERKAFRKLHGIICISEKVRSVLHSAYAIPQTRLRVVPYGIKYLHLDKRPGKSDTPTVLFAGGNFQRKGLEVLIRAAHAVIAAVPDCRFLVVGESRDRKLMQDFVHDQGLANRFEFLGKVPRAVLYQYYCSATVFTMPSLLEAFGIPYLEAMYCGTPVVGSDCPGPSDYLRDGDNALCPQRASIAELADALIAALTDQNLRSRLLGQGYETARGASIGRMVLATIEAYRTFMAKIG